MFIHRRFNPIFINLYHFPLRKKKINYHRGINVFMDDNPRSISVWNQSAINLSFYYSLCGCVVSM